MKTESSTGGGRESCINEENTIGWTLFFLVLIGFVSSAYPQPVSGSLKVPERVLSVDDGEMHVQNTTSVADDESILWDMGKFACIGFKPSDPSSLNGTLDTTSAVDIQQEVKLVSEGEEKIRQLKFLKEVPIRTVSRQQYSQDVREELADLPDSYFEFQDYLLNVMYLIPEGTSTEDIYGNFYGESTLAYYDNGGGTITYIEDKATKSELDATLAHELTHALTAQNYPGAYLTQSITTDADSGISSLIEGDAETVSSLYKKDSSLNVVSPNGGENWAIGTSQSITWKADGLSGSVKIELSRDGGKTWKVIILTTPNDGNQVWKVAGSATAEAKIRVTSAANRTIVDESDSSFNITAP